MRLGVAPLTGKTLGLVAGMTLAAIAATYAFAPHGRAVAVAALVAAGVAIVAAWLGSSLRADRRYATLLEHEVATQTRSLMESLSATATAERQLRLVMDAVPDAIVVLDRDGRVVDRNEPAKRLAARAPIPGGGGGNVALLDADAAATMRDRLAPAFSGALQQVGTPYPRAGRGHPADIGGFERHRAPHLCPSILPALDPQHRSDPRLDAPRTKDLGRPLGAAASVAQPAHQRRAGVAVDGDLPDHRRAQRGDRGRSEAGGRRLGPRDRARDPRQDFRPILHHQAGGRGHGTGPLDLLRGRARARRPHLGRLTTGPGRDVLRVAAARPAPGRTRRVRSAACGTGCDGAHHGPDRRRRDGAAQRIAAVPRPAGHPRRGGDGRRRGAARAPAAAVRRDHLRRADAWDERPGIRGAVAN